MLKDISIADKCHWTMLNFLIFTTTILEKVQVELSLIICEARIRDTIRIRYCTDTPIRKNFKNQDTIRLGYVNKKII
jgi:hypothetical protein